MRIHFVVNPKAGKVRSKDLAAAIGGESAGHEVVISSRPPLLPEREPLRIEDLLWSTQKLNEPDMVVAVGGDGTVNRVVNAVFDHGIPVGIIPCGSSNDLAEALGIPGDFHKACEVIKAGRLTDIDLVSVNGRYFTTCGGFGLAGDVADRANRWRTGRGWRSRIARMLGRKIYPLALLRELAGGWQPPVARTVCGDEDREDVWFSVLVSNQARFGGFSASPKANNRDGLVDICRMRAPSRRLRMLWISLQTLLGRADNCGEVSQHQTRDVTIVTRDPVSFFGDGEILDRGRFFRIQNHPRALWVVVPHGTKTWPWLKHARDQSEQLVKYYLRRPSCRPMTISA